MRIGLSLDRFDWAGPAPALGPALARVARAAEDAGVASLWVMDHLFQIPMFGEPHDLMPEAYTTLGFLAGVTTTVELGTLTTAATYRPPGLLLKIVTTLDALSNGRAWLGIGAPWNDHEQRAFGLPAMSWDERFARLDEILRLTRAVWSGSTDPFVGEHYRLDEPVFAPAPVGPPRLLIGGAHERRILRLVARYGDACNLFETGGIDLIRLKLRVLAENCERIGRPYDDIVKTSFGELGGSPGAPPSRHELADRFATLADAGITHAIVSLPDPGDPLALERIGEVIAALAPPLAPPLTLGGAR
jgi:F420-dependent oxidoreductase-like protein